MTTNMEGERIARLEQHMVDQDNKLKEIADDIKVIKNLIQKQDSFDERLARIEKSRNLWNWLSPSMAAASGVILSILISSYLKNLK